MSSKNKKRKSITFHLVTIFPAIFDSYLNEGMLKRAQKAKAAVFQACFLRDFAFDRHQTVDDTPYGGGPGMVLKVEPIFLAVEAIKKKLRRKKSRMRVILTSARGKTFTQKDAERLKKYDDLIIICGRYEGVDQRVAEKIADEELSIGDYVLTGGELPALVMADSIVRLLPGVLGNKDSLEDESHCGRKKDFDFDYPDYTKPSDFHSWKVPKVLLSGHHGKIDEWRHSKRKGPTGKKKTSEEKRQKVV